MVKTGAFFSPEWYLEVAMRDSADQSHAGGKVWRYYYSRTSHAFEVLFIAHGLEVSTAQQEVHLEAVHLLQPLDHIVDAVSDDTKLHYVVGGLESSPHLTTHTAKHQARTQLPPPDMKAMLVVVVWQGKALQDNYLRKIF
ncbi:hypothetical protein E2C01_026254 [Portunus trituberculatus]|uniref:Uncharacterized protein n=1 Tax=Portunus trituberculatus TaxID=210409 RepID=A0A5B7EI51_PORTR|nr:hypothetical protein [Portunus trituberculatus]